MADNGTPTWFKSGQAGSGIELVFDQWTPMSFKRVLGNKHSGGTNFQSPGWVGSHARRLMAYRVLQAYQDNSARYFLGSDIKDNDRDDHREYGEAALIVNQVCAALLGEDQTIVVERASEFEEEEPVDPREEKIRDLERQKAANSAARKPAAFGGPATNTGGAPPVPDPETGEEDPEVVAVREAEVQTHEADDEIDAEIKKLSKPENDPEVVKAHELQEWLEKWATAERLKLKMIETERNAVGLGDGVYVLGYDKKKKRSRLRVFDPGFYFPVLDDGPEDDYPEKIHLAWELEPDPQRPDKRLVRRITWELGSIAGANQPNLIQRAFGVEVKPLDGDVVQPDGVITRQLPWNDEPTDQTCYMTDAVWELDIANKTIEDLSGATATYLEDEDGPIRDRDLEIDFIPVIHVPNTVALQAHYGRSTLAAVLQVLDDIANTDTDLQAASATTGKPVIALQGATMGAERPTYRAGEILETGDGTMTVLDTSRALDALLKYLEALLKRLSVNVRVPEAVLGRVDAGEVPSGVALALSFGPLASMVAEMRLTRDEKYPLLLKFAHRMALAGGAPDVPADWMPTVMQFGSYLPQDQQAAVEMVVKLMEAKAVSLELAVAILMAAGLPIEDAAREVEAIQSRMFEEADALLTATGDEDAVFEFLGRDRPPGLDKIKPEPPQIVMPGTPGAARPPVPGQAAGASPAGGTPPPRTPPPPPPPR